MNESLIVHRPSSNSFVLKQDFRWEPGKRDALRPDILSALVSSYWMEMNFVQEIYTKRKEWVPLGLVSPILSFIKLINTDVTIGPKNNLSQSSDDCSLIQSVIYQLDNCECMLDQAFIINGFTRLYQGGRSWVSVGTALVNWVKRVFSFSEKKGSQHTLFCRETYNVNLD